MYYTGMQRLTFITVIVLQKIAIWKYLTCQPAILTFSFMWVKKDFHMDKKQHTPKYTSHVPNTMHTDQRGVWTAKDGNEARHLLFFQALSSDLQWHFTHWVWGHHALQHKNKTLTLSWHFTNMMQQPLKTEKQTNKNQDHTGFQTHLTFSCKVIYISPPFLLQRIQLFT